MNHKKFNSISVFALALLLLAMGAMPASATTHTVLVGPNQLLIFQDQPPDPTGSTLTVNVGDTVQWMWQGMHHSTTSGSCATGTCVPDGKWDSGVHDAPNNFSFTFNQAGTFPYFCSIHGTSFQMRGTVKVVAAPDFKLQISNSPLTAFPNQAVNFQGTLTSLNGYSKSVIVSCGGAHPASCGTATVLPTASGAPFSVGASNPGPGTFTFSIMG